MINVYRDRYTTVFNAYDPPGHPGGSLIGRCIFCDIVDSRADRTLWYEDDLVVAFEDIRPASDFHALVIPKRHIRDINFLQPTVADINLLYHMRSVGLKVL